MIKNQRVFREFAPVKDREKVFANYSISLWILSTFDLIHHVIEY